MIHPQASPDPHFRPPVAHLQTCFLPTVPGAPSTSLAPTKCTSTFPCISPAPQPQPSGDSHQLPLHTCLLTCLLMEPSCVFSPTLSSESLPAVSPTPWLVSTCIFGIVTRPMPTSPTASWPVSLPTRLCAASSPASSPVLTFIPFAPHLQLLRGNSICYLACIPLGPAVPRRGR